MQQRKAGRVRLLAVAIGAALALGAGAGEAANFSGTLYFTHFTGGQNVWKVPYAYNESTQAFTVGAQQNVASTNGADGIIFGANGNLLVGGQGSGNVYEVNPSTGAILNTQQTGTASFHLTLAPDGNTVYTSNFGGRLNLVNVPIGSGSSFQNITGDDGGLTQVSFDDKGDVFYVNGQPNGGGNVGRIDLTTGVTNRLFSSVTPAHGIVFDPFTDLMTLFGAGHTGTFDETGANLMVSPNSTFGVGDFDQGAVDGFGHALVAGSDSLTFIDYHTSHDITHPDFTTSVGGFGGIDDVAPLTGPGSNPNPNPTPEPATLLLLGAALAGMATAKRKRP